MRASASLALVAAFALTGIAYAGTGGGQGMAGCGAGSQIFKDNQTKGAQSTAATTNGTLYNQVFGITSGTLGCSSQGGWSMKERSTFVAVNYRELSRELSAGQGEYAVSFAKLMGCSGEGVPAFLDFTRSRYDKLFPAEGATPEGMLSSLQNEIAADASMASVCTL